MTIESVTYIDDLDDNYPAYNDQKKEGDDHIRNIKTALTNSFPNISGAVLPTHTELNFVDGVTSGIQGQFTALDARLDDLEVINPEYLTNIESDVQDQLDNKLSRSFTGIAGENDMLSSLRMGGHDIYDAKDITAESVTTTKGVHGVHLGYPSIGNHEITGVASDDIDLSINSHVFVDISYNSSAMSISANPEKPGFVTLIFWNGTGGTETFLLNVTGRAWGDVNSQYSAVITSQNFSTYHRYAFELDASEAMLMVLFYTGYYYVLIGGAKMGGDAYSDPTKSYLDPNS